ncbi:PAQR family membrane homeostasis protein TrhA [Saccharopolyspora rectivirgula]|uniref:PAQR family membrane homeostasis protein TrhA n=1 Tax=Saccharopolyspora rectivirgula TaxID=28042 RepID=UPI00055C5A66|nr:hemolysin III family protein [Saccharopolyspora rectivirgula]
MSSLTTRHAFATVKPRMRGWIHLWSFFVSIVAGATMITLAALTVSARAAVGTAVYVVTVLGLFGISALYHRKTWKTVGARTWMRRLDHSMIFLFIAGTYTPLAMLAMQPTTGAVVLAVVWGGALGGVILKLAWPNAPRWVGVPVYVALGWVAIFVFPDLLQNAGAAVLTLLIVGGVLYTLGAVFYAARWPDPWPKTFGYHEFFHSAVSAAAICHHVAIWLALYA